MESHAVRSRTTSRTSPFGGFRKRIFTLGDLGRNLRWAWRRREDVRAVWGGGRLDRALREQIMVAVAEVNDCRYCTFVHRAWASDAGVGDEALERIESGSDAGFDPRTAAALSYARARPESDFGDLDPRLERELGRHFDARERSDVELVARAMAIANRSGNTLDALLSRFRGSPAASSRLVDEVAISVAVVLVLLAVTPIAMRHRRSSPLGLWREFRSFSTGFEARRVSA